jgi:hypothetical protein
VQSLQLQAEREAAKAERQRFRERFKSLENDLQEANLECASLTARLEASQQRANHTEAELSRVLEAAETFDIKHGQDALVAELYRKSIERSNSEYKEELRLVKVRYNTTQIASLSLVAYPAHAQQRLSWHNFLSSSPVTLLVLVIGKFKMQLVQEELHEARGFLTEISTQIDEACHQHELCEQRVQSAGCKIQETHERSLALVGVGCLLELTLCMCFYRVSMDMSISNQTREWKQTRVLILDCKSVWVVIPSVLAKQRHHIWHGIGSHAKWHDTQSTY